MKKLLVMVVALAVVFGMSAGVMALNPLPDDYENILDDEQTISTNVSTSVSVNSFATFVYESQRGQFGGLLKDEIDPKIVSEQSLDWGLSGSSSLISDVENIIAIDQYKWTLRANTSTQTTVETTTDPGLADHVNVFYEFSSGQPTLTGTPEWIRYLGANDTEDFGEQVSGVETGLVMVAMDADDYLANWTDIEATGEGVYNMSVTFTISEF